MFRVMLIRAFPSSLLLYGSHYDGAECQHVMACRYNAFLFFSVLGEVRRSLRV